MALYHFLLQKLGSCLVTIPCELGEAPWPLKAAPHPCPLLSSVSRHPQGRKFVYAGSNSGVVQAPVAFCGKHSTCETACSPGPLLRLSPAVAACVACTRLTAPAGTVQTLAPAQPHGLTRVHPVTRAPLSCRGLIQEMNGDASTCPGKLPVPTTSL